MKQGESVSSLEHLVFYPSRITASYPTVIAIHGRGADFFDLPPMIRALEIDNLLVIAPRAPFPFPSGGYAWYELKQEGVPTQGTFGQSLDLLRKFITEIRAAYPVDEKRLFLFGFSQGSVMAYATGLTDHKAFRGIVALSGYVPLKSDLPLELKNLTDLAAFISHGTYDQLISVQYGREAATLLTRAGANVLYKEYPTGHQILDQTVADISEWIKPLVT